MLLQKYALLLAESSTYATNLYHNTAYCDTFADILGSGVVVTVSSENMRHIAQVKSTKRQRPRPEQETLSRAALSQNEVRTEISVLSQLRFL